MRRCPYTERGIKRVPCLRCGKPSAHQWNICSMPGQHGVCNDCDIALNDTVLAFMGVEDREAIMDAYRAKVAA